MYKISGVIKELEEAKILHKNKGDIYLKENKDDKFSMVLSEISVITNFIEILEDKYDKDLEISSFMLETIIKAEITYSDRCVIAKVLDNNRESAALTKNNLERKIHMVRSLVDILITID